MSRTVRRLVTGHDKAGRSVFLHDGPAPGALPSLASPKMISTLIWRTTTSPASYEGDEDMAPAGFRVPTAPQQRGGTAFRVTDIPPDSELGDLSKVDISKQGVHVSAEGRKRHVMFHTTDTVDYAIVLEGEIWAVLDDDERLMKQGDVLVQCGTGHAWSNRSDKPCRMAFILIDAEPKRT